MKKKKIYCKDDMIKIFREIGVRSGMSIMIHSSLSGLGYLVNGPYDIIDALFELIGPNGTLLVPAHSGHLTEPRDWKNPPVPKEWVKKIKQNMNPFDPVRTPITNRGILPQYFLHYPGVKRSSHPFSSVAAIGKKTEYFTADHPLHESEGIGSPCYKLYEDGGYVLLLGVGLESCTAIHVAEFISDCSYLYETNVKVLVTNEKNRNTFVKLKKYPGSSLLFEKLRPELENKEQIKTLWIDDYKIDLFHLKDAINIAVNKLKEQETYFRQDD